MKRYAFILILLATPCSGAILPPGAKTELIDDWSGGLNTTIKAHKLDKKFSPNMSNIFCHRVPGSIIKRNGSDLVGSTSTLRYGGFMFTFSKENGDKEFIVSDSSVVLTTRDFVTYTTIITTLNINVNLDCAQVRNKVWCTNGLDPVFTWDGSTRTVLDGTSGTPNVPKFRYIEFDQERVWGLNTSGNGSSLDFSSLVSTDGISIAPDDSRAWPVTNRLNVGQGDGQVGTALWVYRGQLQVGKERSIYTRYGTNASNYFARKTESEVGPISNDSVVVQDGLTYYKGLDGIYAYDGGICKRISDGIVPDVQLMFNPINNILQNIWESQMDFSKGNFSFGSTATPTGLITIQNATDLGLGNPQYFLNTFQGAGTDNLELSFANPAGVLAKVNLNLATPIQDTFSGNLRKISIFSQTASGCDPAVKLKMSAKNIGTNQTITSEGSLQAVSVLKEIPFGDGNTHGDDVITGTASWSGYQLNNSSMQIKLELTGANAGCSFVVFSPTGPGNSDITFTPATTIQYLSQVSTLTNVTAWGRFDAQQNSAGGAIDYYIRTSTSAVNISTQTWKLIAPGVTINAPTINNFIQWAATVTSVSTNPVTYIDNVTITHVEGSGASSNRSFAIGWSNEYWLSIATETSGLFSIQYVKSWITNSNPNAWNRMNGMNLRSFTKDGSSILYGGAASTGAFYRLDYGTNDNGQLIDAFYDTPKFVAENYFNDKNLLEVHVDADKNSGGNLKIGKSVNGSAFTYDTISLDGTDRSVRTLYGYGKSGNYFQFRLRNDQLDEPMAVHNFGYTYTPSGVRTDLR